MHFGEGVHADGGAGGQGRTMAIFFTTSFLKDQIEAPGRGEVQGLGKHLC